MGKLCANVVSVLIARHLVRDMVMEKVVKKSDLLTMVAEAVKDEPWKMAFLVRGSMVPLFVKNYGLGVTDVGYLPNACCSMIFTNFYAAQNIYMGSTMSNLQDVFAPKKDGAGPQDWTSKAKALMPIFFNIVLVIVLVKALKKQFKKQREEIQEKLKKKNRQEVRLKIPHAALDARQNRRVFPECLVSLGNDGRQTFCAALASKWKKVQVFNSRAFL